MEIVVYVLLGLVVLGGTGSYLRDRWWKRRWAAAGVTVDKYNADQQILVKGKLDTLATQHAAALSARDRDERDRAQRAADRYAAVVAERDAVKREAAESGRVSTAEIAALTKQVRRHIDQGDLAARDQIVDACKAAGLAGAVVLSNLVFKPLDASDANPFYAQVDHLVVAPGGVLVVENKYWDAVVLDGVVPAPQYVRGLITEDEIEAVQAGRTVLRIARNRATAEVTVYRHGGSSADYELTPAKQACRQARRLRDLLHASRVPCRWVQACVFYSHSRAAVSYRSPQGEAVIAADAESLGKVIRSVLGRGGAVGTAAVVVDDVLDVLAPFAGSIRNVQ